MGIHELRAALKRIHALGDGPHDPARAEALLDDLLAHDAVQDRDDDRVGAHDRAGDADRLLKLRAFHGKEHEVGRVAVGLRGLIAERAEPVVGEHLLAAVQVHALGVGKKRHGAKADFPSKRFAVHDAEGAAPDDDNLFDAHCRDSSGFLQSDQGASAAFMNLTRSEISSAASSWSMPYSRQITVRACSAAALAPCLASVMGRTLS